MAGDDRELRQELIAARDNLRHQIDILRNPTNVGGGADNREALADLEAELAQIEEALRA